MEGGRDSTRNWCHGCNRLVDLIVVLGSVECSLCHSRFVEEMDGIRSDHHQPDVGDLDFERDLTALTLTLFGTMINHRRPPRFRQPEVDEDVRHHEFGSSHRQGGESILRRRSSATILQPEINNPLNQTIIVRDGGGGGAGGNPFDPSQNHPIGSLELPTPHLAENDPNHYGTPPAQIEAVKAMPTVTIDKKSIRCTICMDDFEVGAKAKQMPCKHRFHSSCILRWLELHSSCPHCRYQLPSDKSKLDKESESSRGSMGNANGGGEDRDGRVFSVSRQRPFNSFPSTSGSSLGNLSSSFMASTSRRLSGLGASGSGESRRASGEGSSTGRLSSSFMASTSSPSGSGASRRARRSEDVARKEKN